MSGFTTALDALAADDRHGLSGPELPDRTRDLVAARNRLDAELARTVRRAEAAQAPECDGLTTMQSWLRGHCRLSNPAAGQLVRNGRALEQLPAVAAAHAAGQLTADQVGVISDVVKPRNLALAADQDVDLPGIDEALAGIAAIHSHAELTKAVHHYVARLDQDGPEPDPTEQRELTFAKHADGSLSFRGHLDPVGGEKFQAAVESIVQADRPAGDTRSRAQRLADALVQLCDNHLASGNLPFLRTVKPQAMVVIDAEDLLDPATGPAAAETGFGGVISAARARWAACDAGITRILLDPDGVPLDVGRTQRLVTPAIRKTVEVRDKHGVFAGCSAPTWWCEVHHLIAWALGGESSLENSGLLCERHHTQVHHGFTVERDETGRWHTYRPDGTEIHVLRPPIPAEDDPAPARAG